MDSDFRQNNNSGLVFYGGAIFLKYVDKEGNIASVEIKPDKISSLHSNDVRGIQERVRDELEKLGFLLPGETEGIGSMEGDEILRKIGKEMQNYKEKIEKQIREKRAEEFDF